MTSTTHDPKGEELQNILYGTKISVRKNFPIKINKTVLRVHNKRLRIRNLSQRIHQLLLCLSVTGSGNVSERTFL
jgi:hypothetical protein